MATLKFDYETIRNNVLPQLDSILSDLNAIASKLNSMDIPNFGKSNYINETKNDINNSINEIKRIINWINESNRLLDNVIDNYEKEAKYLPLYLLNKRDGIIK